MTYQEFVVKLVEFLQEDPRIPFREGGVSFCGKGLDIAGMDEELRDYLLNVNRGYYNTSSEILQGDVIVCRGSSTGNLAEMYRFLVGPKWEVMQKEGWDAVARNFIEYFEHFEPKDPMQLVSVINDYEKIRSHLFFRLKNYAKYSLKIEEGVYERIGDIAMCLYVLVSRGSENVVSFKVPAPVFEGWGLSRKQVFFETLENAERMMPPSICRLTDLGTGRNPRTLAPGELKDATSPRQASFLTTTTHRNGAAAIFYPGLMEKLADAFDGNFYVGFTSVDECVLHSTKVKLKLIRGSILDMDNIVEPEDRLSHSVFLYDRSYGKLQMLN